MIERLTSGRDEPAEEAKEVKPRVYMDELKGILRDFTGDTLTLTADETDYVFDVSNASLECENGMITGDEITVIYEGQLSGTGGAAGQITVLKVTDDYRIHTDPTASTASGTIQELSPNRITLTLEDQKTITFPTTGCEEYFSGGVRPGLNVTVHYLGSLENAAADDASPYDAFHVKAVTISDVEPYTAPDTSKKDSGDSGTQSFQGVIQSLQTNSLTITVSGENTISLDLSGVSSYFPGGPMPGSKVTVSYYGDFDGADPNTISVVSVTGENPSKVSDTNLSFSVAGNIRGRTQNTMTILTTDGAYVTFRIDDAEDVSTSGLEIGSDVRVIFNPAENRTTNVYSCIRIKDA